MNVLKCFKLLFGLTTVALMYLQMQMQIITLAYQGKARQQQIKRLVEEKLQLTHKLFTLESVDHVGDKILAEDSHMQFMHPSHVIEIAASDGTFEKGDAGSGMEAQD